MTKTTLAALGAALLSTAFIAPASTIDLPQYGFTIDALDAKPASAPATALMMMLPPSEGFAPNVNVNIQPYPKGIKEYVALSKGQLEGMKLTMIAEKQIGESEWQAEYKGEMDGNDLHFYARAVLKEGKVYLVTGTAKASQWEKVGQELRKHVDSFKTK